MTDTSWCEHERALHCCHRNKYLFLQLMLTVFKLKLLLQFKIQPNLKIQYPGFYWKCKLCIYRPILSSTSFFSLYRLVEIQCMNFSLFYLCFSSTKMFEIGGFWIQWFQITHDSASQNYTFFFPKTGSAQLSYVLRCL